MILIVPLMARAEDRAADSANREAESGVSQEKKADPRAILSAQLKTIVNASGLSPEEKEKQIAAAVQAAIVNATAQIKDPDQILKVTVDFAAVAAQAAPQFSTTIIDTISAIPSISSIEGGSAKIQSVVVDVATKAASVSFAPNPPKESKEPKNSEFGGDSGETVVSRYR